MYFVYMLFSEKLGKFYTGYSQDISSRLKQHNRGLVPFTARGIPWELVYYGAFTYKEDALREEKFLKTGKGRERRGYLLERYIQERRNKRS